MGNLNNKIRSGVERARMAGGKVSAGGRRMRKQRNERLAKKRETRKDEGFSFVATLCVLVVVITVALAGAAWAAGVR